MKKHSYAKSTAIGIALAFIVAYFFGVEQAVFILLAGIAFLLAMMLDTLNVFK